MRRTLGLLFLAFVASARADDRPSLQVGFAEEGFAHAVVLSDVDTKVAIVSLDVFGVSAKLHDAVAERVEDLSLDEFVLAGRPAPSAPFTGGRAAWTQPRPSAPSGTRGFLDYPLWRGSAGAFDPAYFEETVRRIEQTIRAAGLEQRPARLSLIPTALYDTPGISLSVDSPAGEARGVLIRVAAQLEVRVGPWRPIARTGEVTPLAPDVSVLRVPTKTAWTCGSALLGRRETSCLAPEKAVDLPIAHVVVGAWNLVTTPGQPTEGLRHAMGESPTTWVVSAQDDLGRLADREWFRRYGAEDDEVLFGPDAADALVRALDREAKERDTTLLGTGLAEREPVRIHGKTPRELGEDHGRRLYAAIPDLLRAAEAHWSREILAKGGGFLLAREVKETGLPAKDLIGPAMVRVARSIQEQIPADLLDEMEGIAEGAGVPYDAILLENVFGTLAEQTNKAAMLTMPARCTNVVALGPATSMGQLIHASTLDWGMVDVLKDRTITMVVEPPEGHPFVSVGWPGMVGTLRAMGAQGIAITEESCEAKDDTALQGLPVNLLMRRVVQRAANLDEAVTMVRETPGTCGYKVTISDGHRLDARVVEVTAHLSQVRAPKDGLLFGCDPEAPCLGGPCDPAIPRNDPESAVRYPAIRTLLESARGQLRTPLVSSALATTTGGVLNAHTLLAAVFEPQTGRFHVALGDDVDAAEGTLAWKSYSLPELLTPAARAPYVDPRPVTSIEGVTAKKRPISLGKIEVWDVEFDSPRPSAHEFNDRVHGELFLPPDALGVVTILPPWKEPTLAGDRLVATALAAKGIAGFVLPLPYQGNRTPPGVKSGAWTLSDDLARTREALLQGVEDAARVSLWLERSKGFPAARQGVMGISLGGHVAAVAAGAYPDRFGSGAFLLAGCNVDRTFLQKNGITDKIRAALLARGVTPEEAMGFLSVLDPGHYGLPSSSKRMLLIGCREDPVVPPVNVEALAEAWGGARIEWFDGNHFGLLAHMGTALDLVVDHFKAQFGAR